MGVGAGVRTQRAAPSPGLRPTSPTRGEVGDSAAARGAGPSGSRRRPRGGRAKAGHPSANGTGETGMRLDHRSAPNHVFSVHSLRSLLSLKSVESGIGLEFTPSVECADAQNRRTLSLVRRLAFGRQAAGSKQCQEPRMFWRPERCGVKLDSGSQEHLGGRLCATAFGACPGTGSLPHWRTPRRGPSPRPSPGGRGSKIVVTPRWELRVCGDGDFLKLLSLTIIYYHFFGQLFVMRSHIPNLALQRRYFALPRVSRVRRPAWSRAENREWGETGSF